MHVNGRRSEQVGLQWEITLGLGVRQAAKVADSGGVTFVQHIAIVSYASAARTRFRPVSMVARCFLVLWLHSSGML